MAFDALGVVRGNARSADDWACVVMILAIVVCSAVRLMTAETWVHLVAGVLILAAVPILFKFVET